MYVLDVIARMLGYAIILGGILIFFKSMFGNIRRGLIASTRKLHKFIAHQGLTGYKTGREYKIEVFTGEYGNNGGNAIYVDGDCGLRVYTGWNEFFESWKEVIDDPKV